MLYLDAEMMFQRLAAAGVPVTFQVWDRQVHVFQAAADLIPEAHQAIAQIGEFIRMRTAATSTTAAPTARAANPVVALPEAELCS